jgi:hypothetical protein
MRGPGGRTMLKQLSVDVQSRVAQIRETHAPRTVVGDSGSDELVSRD